MLISCARIAGRYGCGSHPCGYIGSADRFGVRTVLECKLLVSVKLMLSLAGKWTNEAFLPILLELCREGWILRTLTPCSFHLPVLQGGAHAKASGLARQDQ